MTPWSMRSMVGFPFALISILQYELLYGTVDAQFLSSILDPLSSADSFPRFLSCRVDEIADRLPFHPIMPADFDIIDVFSPTRGFRHNAQRQVLAHRSRGIVFHRVVGLAKSDLPVA